MARPKGNKQGSIFFDKNAKKWRAMYYVTDNETKEEKKITKSFVSEQEAKDFLATKLYQKNNEIFIKNNGIPLNQLMRANLQKKLDMNLISETQYMRVLKTIELIENNKKIITEYRTVLVPGLITKNDIEAIASILPKNAIWMFSNFENFNCLNPKFNNILPYTNEESKELVEHAKKIIKNAALR